MELQATRLTTWPVILWTVLSTPASAFFALAVNWNHGRSPDQELEQTSRTKACSAAGGGEKLMELVRTENLYLAFGGIVVAAHQFDEHVDIAVGGKRQRIADKAQPRRLWRTARHASRGYRVH